MIRSTPDGVVISVRVIPRSGKSVVAGTRAGALLVRLQAPPVEGAANGALVELLASVLDVPKRAVSILSGEHSRQKLVRVAGLDLDTATARLAAGGG